MQKATEPIQPTAWRKKIAIDDDDGAHGKNLTPPAAGAECGKHLAVRLPERRQAAASRAPQRRVWRVGGNTTSIGDQWSNEHYLHQEIDAPSPSLIVGSASTRSNKRSSGLLY
jgi:hypothetical protein